MNLRMIMLRETLRWSASDVARRADVSIPTVIRTELESTSPSPKTRQKLADALGASEEYLFPEDGQENA